MTWPTNRDTELFDLIDHEIERQNTTLQLIASENFTSPAVMEATGSVLTNKYSEGYPASGTTAATRSSTRSRTWPGDGPGRSSAPSTPTSSPTPGPTPTWPSTWPCSSPGDKVLGMSLDHGGHLTHGSPVNISGRLLRLRRLRRDDERRAPRLRPDPRPGQGRACPR